MKTKNNLEEIKEKFKFESLGNQLVMIRRYLNDKYSIQYMTGYLILEDNRKMIIDTNADGEVNFDVIDKNSIQIKVNSNCLREAKTRKIKARYSIPMTVNTDKRILIVLEDKIVDRFDSIEKNILEDIEELFDSIEKND